MICSKFNIEHDLFVKYESDAMATYSSACFDNDKIMSIAKKAQLLEENQQLIADFLSCTNEDVKKFMWVYYYILFETEEYFENELWTVVDNFPLPTEWEEKYPGMMTSCIYLLASEHLKAWLEKESLGEEFLEGYFTRYRYFADLNKTEVNTYGLVKLSPFLYGYSKPFMLVIGRLTYQLKDNYNYCELYEDSQGKRIMIATDQCKYGPDGHMHENGEVPLYINNGISLTGHTYDDNGRLCKDTITLDLREYKKILSPGDKVATIHIPGTGKLDEESVQESLDRAMEIIPKHLAPIKSLICQTWFLDPNIRGVFKEGANMLKFANRFDIICAIDNENHSLYQHVFQCAKCPLEELVPKNDFQAKMLERAKNGEKIYWSYGILK